jgi:hypothetical protein
MVAVVRRGEERCEMADAGAALPAALGPALPWVPDLVAEVRSPCPDFRVVVLSRCGKQLYEAYRVSGTGTLYSVTTTDPAELDAVLRRACSRGCSSG